MGTQTPLKWLDTIKSEIVFIYKIKFGTWQDVNGSIEEIDMDIVSIKDSTCRKIVYGKVQGVDYDKIGSSVAIFEVYTDCSSNQCI